MIDVSISGIKTVADISKIFPNILEKIKVLLTRIQVSQCEYMRDDQIIIIGAGVGSTTITFTKALSDKPIVIAMAEDTAATGNAIIAYISAISTTQATISLIDESTGAAPVGIVHLHVIIRERNL